MLTIERIESSNESFESFFRLLRPSQDPFLAKICFNYETTSKQGGKEMEEGSENFFFA